MSESNGQAQNTRRVAEHAVPGEKSLSDEQQLSQFENGSAFPDGGTKAWLTVAGGSACLFVSFGWVNCMGVFQDHYATNQLSSYSQSEISWIPALQSKQSLFYENKFTNI